MKHNKEKIDEMVLALLYLTTFDESIYKRAWRGHDWDALDRLYQKGYISDPKNKNRSVIMSDEGAELSEKLFKKHFGV